VSALWRLLRTQLAEHGLPLATITCLATALVLGGCGLGAGHAPGTVQLLVTRDFGAGIVRQFDRPAAKGEETVMSLLMRNDPAVTTRFGGGFVQSIEGVSGGQEAGQPVDWFYYVNGIQATKGAASTKVHAGDRIWWDHHDWSQTEQVPAVVGSYPEPFLHGTEGKRLPVRVECAEARSGACRTVAERLGRLGVPAGISGLGASGEPGALHVLVGRWSSIRRQEGARTIDEGTRSSGVYARFSRDGSRLMLLDARGRAARELLAGAGLLAATRHAGDAPVWVVTGTDPAGVDLAARALEASALHDRFAVALAQGGGLPVPVRGGASR
jgi:hypothetical protein